MNPSSTEKKRRSIYAPLIFCFVILFNPNISVIDIMPDFIAYFILARLFLYPSDCSPHFEEARVAFKRLGWLNLMKFFGLFVMLFVKKSDPRDNDIIPLVTIVFAVFEALLMVIAIKEIFDALFHLGNRSDAVSTIQGPEKVRYFSFLFAIAKCAIYFIPTPFLLSSTTTVAGAKTKLAKSFIRVLILSQLAGIVIGIFWLVMIIKYTKSIKEEGKFFSALSTVLKKDKSASLEKKILLRRASSALSLLATASFFTIELALVENYDINVIPHFIYAFLLLLFVYKLCRFSKNALLTYISGFVYLMTTIVNFVFQYRFLTEYGYDMLLTSKEARDAYPKLNVLSIIEFLALTVFLILLALLLKNFILKNTGIDTAHLDSKGREQYHRSLIGKNYALLTAGILAGAIKCLSVILHGNVKVVYTAPTNEFKPTVKDIVIAPSVEWIGLLVTVFAIIYICYALYFTSTLRDEVKLKYQNEEYES